MQNYEKPKISVISLKSEDVLAESGEEKTLKNASLKDGGKSVSFDPTWLEVFPQ